MIVLAIIAAIIILIIFISFLMPIHIVIAYKKDIAVYLRILFVKIILYPNKENRNENKKSKALSEESRNRGDKPDTVQTIKIIYDRIHFILDRFVRYVKITVKKYSVVIGGDDAAQTALLYGAAVQASSYLFAFLDYKTRFYVSGRAKPSVKADFTSKKSSVDIKIDLKTNIVGAVGIIMSIPQKLTKSQKNK